MTPFHSLHGFRSFFPAVVVCATLIGCGETPASAQNRVPMMPAQAGGQMRSTVRVAPVLQGARVVSGISSTHTVNRPRTQVQPARRNSGNHRRSVAPALTCAVSPNLSAQQLLQPFPSNGFDFQHLNSINSDLPIEAAIDPATQVALRTARQLDCGAVATGGFLLWGGGYGVPEQVVEDQTSDSESEAKPQVIVVQVPAASSATGTGAEAKPAAASGPPADKAPLPDQGPFVLVMRDGSQVKATAFMRSADQLIYISLDGLRHVVPLANIDADATVKLNGEHGSQIQISL